MYKLTRQKTNYDIVAGILLILLFSIGSSTYISTYHEIQAEASFCDAGKFEYSESYNFDFEEILKRGTIRMITRYTSGTYFLYEGKDRGFEYELVSRFAREHGLKVEVVLINPGDDVIEMLNRGKGDLIAKHVAVTSDRAKLVAYSRPYDMVFSQTEIERSNHQYAPDDYYYNESDRAFLEEETFAWAMRDNSPLLKQKADDFLQKHFQLRETDGRILRSAFLNQLRRLYFNDDNLARNFQNRNYDTIHTGYLSPYDEMIKQVAEESGVDWKLVVAVMAQESAFNPYAESDAGALGLMQIIPRFSLVENEEMLYDPETNIREGVRYLKKHLDNNAHLDSLNRYSMALATYNVGSGNMADAKQLVVQLGNNPDEWNHVAEALLMLMHPEYYEDARYGYKRGTETVNYVKDVLIRYNRYHTVFKWAEHTEDLARGDFMVLQLAIP
ncbi:MAG: transglycosylase SLT domain-containing protein [Balneolaceae bacterium]|nr:transglycosylase SLT domain-containing protein [Balneolaceae bacterium]